MNIYGHSGTDNLTRIKGENFFAETVTNMLVDLKRNGCFGGDINMMIDNKDASVNQA